MREETDLQAWEDELEHFSIATLPSGQLVGVRLCATPPESVRRAFEDFDEDEEDYDDEDLAPSAT